MVAALIVALLVLVNALYVAAEFAAVSARRTRMDQMAAAGNRLARQLLPVLRDSQALDRYVAACQVGITATSLLLGAYGQNVLAGRLTLVLTGMGRLAAPTAHSLAVTSMLLLLTGLQMVLGELLPKSIAIQYPERLALATLVPLRWSLRLFQPLIWLLNGSGNLLLKALRIDSGDRHGAAHTPAEIELLAADSQEGGLLTPGARRMLRNALRLRDMTAREIMTPLSRLVAAPAASSVSDLLRLCSRSGFSRIPIYRGNIDHIIGFAHIKDLLRMSVWGNESTADILRTARFIPETMPVAAIWETLAAQRQYIAPVRDEHGGTAGLITYEDLIGQVFGELQDEFDAETVAVSTYRRRIHG